MKYLSRITESQPVCQRKKQTLISVRLFKFSFDKHKIPREIKDPHSRTQ